MQLEHFGNGLRPWWKWYTHDPTEGSDQGKIWVSKKAAKNSTYGLTCHVKKGSNLYVYFKPWSEEQQVHFYAKSLIQTGTWKPQKYNRLRLYLKTSRFLEKRTNGGFNFHLGTYYRTESTAKNLQETGNGHFYYYHLLKPAWWQVLEVDLCHPHHQRDVFGPNGAAIEWGRRDTPSGQPGPWMADLLTSFYLDAKGHLPHTSQYYLDSVEFVAIPKTEPIDEIYGVTAGYAPNKKKAFLSWSKRRDSEGQKFDVYWSKRRITRQALGAATKVGEGIQGLGRGGWNACTW